MVQNRASKWGVRAREAYERKGLEGVRALAKNARQPETKAFYEAWEPALAAAAAFSKSLAGNHSWSGAFLLVWSSRNRARTGLGLANSYQSWDRLLQLPIAAMMKWCYWARNPLTVTHKI